MKHQVTGHKLPGGARGLIIDVPGSSVINLEVRFNSGFSFGDRRVYEVPHVLEHMLAVQSQRYPKPNQLMIEGSKNGAYMNANTGLRSNGYVYEFAPFELERILDLLEEQVARPLITQERLDGELSNVREELTRNTTQPGSVGVMALLAATQPDQWLDYPERLAQLSEITIADLSKHLQATYTAGNSFFSVAGDIGDGAAILKRLTTLYAAMQSGRSLAWRAVRALALPEPVVRHQPINQIYYRFGRSMPELSLADRRALALLRGVLVGGMGSRILGKARERGWAYSIGSMISAEPGATNFGFGGYVTPENIANLFELVGQEFQAVADGSVTEVELAAVARLLTGSWLRSMQTPADLLNWYSEEYDEWGKIRGFDDELEALCKVKPKDLVTMAQRVLHEGWFAMSLVGDISSHQAGDFKKCLGIFAL